MLYTFKNNIFDYIVDETLESSQVCDHCCFSKKDSISSPLCGIVSYLGQDWEINSESKKIIKACFESKGYFKDITREWKIEKI